MASKTQKTESKYQVTDLTILEGLEPIRQSPAQYIGDVDAVSPINGKGREADGEVLTAGGMHLFVEVFANSSDEGMNVGTNGKSYANYIEVILHEDQSITVTDNGRGIPPDINEANGLSGLEITYLTMNAGGKFKNLKDDQKGHLYANSAGVHGVGAACVAALSDRVDVTVWRYGNEYTMSIKEGVAGTFADDNIRAKFTPAKPGKAVKVSKDKRAAAEKKKIPTGTRVHWHPDPKIWDATDIPWKDICEHVAAQSYMAPQCTFVLIDETELGGGSKKNPVVHTYHHPRGIVEMIEESTQNTSNISPIISFEVPATYERKMVVDDEDGNQISKMVEYSCMINVAMRWADITGPSIQGYANAVHCRGKHVDGFKRGVQRAVSNFIKDTPGVLTKKDEKDGVTPVQEDSIDGLIAVIEVLLEDQCRFLGQTKEELTNKEVLSCVSDTVLDQLQTWLNTKKNATAARKIAKNAIESAKLRNKQKKERENAKKMKEFQKSNSWPIKLTNCSEYDDPRSELIIVEGDSAANPCRAMRDSRFQAVFPIRGKIKNTFDLPLQGSGRKKGVLDNEEAAAILKIYQHYHNIIILSDADPDGAHIEILVYTLFYKHMPEVVEEGRIFAVDAPLYIIKTTGDDQPYLAKNDAERDSIIGKLKKAGKKIQTPIMRIKGWDELAPELVEQTCLNPETRVLRKLTINDMERAEKTLALAMGNDIQSRKEWLIDRLDYGDIQFFN